MTSTVKLNSVHGLQQQRKRVSTSQLVPKGIIVFLCSSSFYVECMTRGSYFQRTMSIFHICQVLYSLCCRHGVFRRANREIVILKQMLQE